MLVEVNDPCQDAPEISHGFMSHGAMSQVMEQQDGFKLCTRLGIQSE